MILRQLPTVGVRGCLLVVLGLAVLFCSVHTASAERHWKHVMTLGEKRFLFADPASARRDGEVVTMWSRFVFEPAVDLNGIETTDTTELWAYDCGGKRRSIIEFIIRDIKGVDHVWKAPTPIGSRLESVDDSLTGIALLGIACRYAR